MQSHPTHDELLEHCRALTGDGQPNRSVEAHAQICGSCRDELVELTAVLAALRAPALTEAPDSWVATARERLDQLETAQRPESLVTRLKGHLEQTKSLVRKVIREVEAGLVLDSHAGALLPGIRGGSTSAPQQLLFESNLGQILLQVDTQGKKHDIRGQFLPVDGEIEPEAHARLSIDGKAVVAPVSSTGEFCFSQISSGQVRLRIETSEYAVNLTPMILPTSPDS